MINITQWLDLDRRIKDELDMERATYCSHLCQVREKKEGE